MAKKAKASAHADAHEVLDPNKIESAKSQSGKTVWSDVTAEDPDPKNPMGGLKPLKPEVPLNDPPRRMRAQDGGEEESAKASRPPGLSTEAAFADPAPKEETKRVTRRGLKDDGGPGAGEGVTDAATGGESIEPKKRDSKPASASAPIGASRCDASEATAVSHTGVSHRIERRVQDERIQMLALKATAGVCALKWSRVAAEGKEQLLWLLNAIIQRKITHDGENVVRNILRTAESWGDEKVAEAIVVFCAGEAWMEYLAQAPEEAPVYGG